MIRHLGLHLLWAMPERYSVFQALDRPCRSKFSPNTVVTPGSNSAKIEPESGIATVTGVVW